MGQSWRTARVFISSTFRDMHAERDHLVRVVFPKLRQLVEPRRIYLEDIDLRWGITREQAENTETLDLCLKSIDECRPFFIALLGERYGACLQAPRAVFEERGLVDFADRSVTELEIVHGAFANAAAQSRSCFFFRDPDAVSTIPPERRGDYVSTDPTEREKLKILKERIRTAGYGVVENYPAQWQGGAEGRLGTLEEFGQAVFDYLWSALGEEFQFGGGEADVIESGGDDPDLHERFLETRARAFVGRTRELDALRAYARGAQPVSCLVFGESGGGKSAILAKFILEARQEWPDALISPYFVGASQASTSLTSLLTYYCKLLQPLARPREADDPDDRDPMEKLNDLMGDESQLPATLLGLKRRFGDLILRARPQKRIILVIDAIDQLDISAAAAPLDWLPKALPASLRIIASCVENSERGAAVLAAFRQRPHAAVEASALNGDDRRAVISIVPSLSAKTLDRKQKELLAQNAACGNALYLRAALEELRTFGSFEQLTTRIKSLPSIKTGLFAARKTTDSSALICDLFEQIFERLEGEFNTRGVERVLSAIACARRGMRDSELVAFAAKHLVAGDVHALLRQLRPYLFFRQGALTFYHYEVRAAVQRRYLSTPDRERQVRAELADHFSAEFERMLVSRETSDPAALARVCDETAWLLLKAERFCDTADLILDHRYMEAKVELGWVRALADDLTALIAAVRGRNIAGIPYTMLSLFEEALNRDADFLVAQPKLLLQCMWNACWWIDCPRWRDYADLDANPGLPETGETPTVGMSFKMEAWWAEAARRPDAPSMLRSLLAPLKPLGMSAGRTINISVVGVLVIPRTRQFIGWSDNRIEIWHADNGDLVRRISSAQPLTTVSATRTGDRIAASSDGLVHIYHAATGETICEIQTPKAPELQFTAYFPVSGDRPPLLVAPGATLAAISSTGEKLATAARGEFEIVIWDVVRTPARRKVLRNAFHILSIHFALPNRLVVSGFKVVDPASYKVEMRSAIWDTDAGSKIYEAPVEIIRYSADGERLLSCAPGCAVERQNGNISVQRLRSGAISAPPLEIASNNIAYSENGLLIALAPTTWMKQAGNDVHILHAESGELLETLRPGHTSAITSMAFMAAENETEPASILTASKDAVRITPLALPLRQAEGAVSDTPRPKAGEAGSLRRWVPKRHASRVIALAFSPDGRHLLSAAADKTIIWNTADGTWLRPPDPGVDAAALSPDGMSYVAGSRGALAIISVADGAVLASAAWPRSNIEGVFYGRDGNLVVAVLAGHTPMESGSAGPTREVQILAARDLSIVARHTYDAEIKWADVHPDGDHFLRCDAAGHVQVARVDTGDLVSSFDVDPNLLRSVSFSSTGEHIVSTRILSTIVWTWQGERVWELNAEIASPARYPNLGRFRLSYNSGDIFQLVVSANESGAEIAYFPFPAYLPQLMAQDANGRVFAVASECDVFLLRLERAPNPGDTIYAESLAARASADRAWARGDVDVARRELGRAVQMLGMAQHDQRESFAPDLMRSLLGLAIVHSTQRDLERAVSCGKDGLDLARVLAGLPVGEALAPEFAQAALLQAERYEALGRADEALEAQFEALEQGRRAAALDPKLYLSLLAHVLKARGDLLARLGRREEALPFLEEAVDVWRDLAAGEGNYVPSLAACVHALAAALSGLGRAEEAERRSAAAIELYRQLAVSDRAAYLRALTDCLSIRAWALKELGQLDEALAVNGEAVIELEELLTLDRAANGLLAGVVLNVQAAIIADIGRNEEAVALLRRALGILGESEDPRCRDLEHQIGTRLAQLTGLH